MNPGLAFAAPTPSLIRNGGLLAPLLRRLANLGVGRKLLLIYLLDMCTVAFICGILIHEKYLAIDFARHEMAGAAYVGDLRPVLVAIGRSASLPDVDAAVRGRLEEAERHYGTGLGSAGQAAIFGRALADLDRAEVSSLSNDVAVRRHLALEEGLRLVTQVGNQSNLIVDPELDSYYTMSLILLRYPALLHALAQITSDLRDAADGDVLAAEERTRLYVLDGELSSVAKAVRSDYDEAVAASPNATLQQQLSGPSGELAASIDRFRATVREIAAGQEVDTTKLDVAERVLLDALDAAWGTGLQQIDRLLGERVHDYFVRMWLHLGTAAGLLGAMLLAVFYVARRIAQPLRALSGVVDTVRRTGDHSLRSHWASEDEIGRLVVGFNDMLAQLDAQRKIQQELAANARAAEAQQRLLELMPVPLMVTSVPDHKVLHANPQARHWLGEITHDPWAAGMSGDLRRRFFQQLADRGEVREFEVPWRHGDHPAWAVLSARRLDYQGSDAVVTAFTPINGLKAMEQRLELWAKVFEASSEGMLLLDAEMRIVAANRAICRAAGVDALDVVGGTPDFVHHGEQTTTDARTLWDTAAQRGYWRGEVQVRRRNGRSYPAWAELTAVRDAAGRLAHYIMSCLDITDRKASEEQVRYLAQHDVLTGLPNRSVVEQRLAQAIQQSQRSGAPLAVLFIDLDRFKTINDSLGHQTGDALLQQVAQRLRLAIREADTVSRFGGDEFVVLLNGVSGSGEALQIAQRLCASLRAGYRIAAHELNVSCSIGIAMFPGDAEDMAELMRHADAAMYEAKATGRDNVYFFTRELNERAHQRLQVERLLRNAIPRGELTLVFQPQVGTADGSLTAVEALLRWHTPELGDVTPGVFIPLAEESRLILPIGEWVIDEACRQLADWRARGIDVGVVSVNLSAVQLLDPGLVPALRSALARHGVPAGQIELELTESILMESTDDRLRQLEALKAVGVQLSIDDFGTGYSSLGYLSRLPMDKLKIDRSLVADMLSEPKDRMITEAIIALAHRLRMTVVAEGVESAAVQAALAEAWCDSVQGFHTGRPMRAEAFEAWLLQRQREADRLIGRLK